MCPGLRVHPPYDERTQVVQTESHHLIIQKS